MVAKYYSSVEKAIELINIPAYRECYASALAQAFRSGKVNLYSSLYCDFMYAVAEDNNEYVVVGCIEFKKIAMYLTLADIKNVGMVKIIMPDPKQNFKVINDTEIVDDKPYVSDIKNFKRLFETWNTDVCTAIIKLTKTK